jgi:predicted choloylglycine hydrolase
MFHPRVKGTYYKMGYGYGTILHKHGFRVPQQTTEKLDFGRKCQKEVNRFFPEVLEEIQGFADACHTSYEQSAALILSIGAFKVELIECSAFATFNDSDVVFGRNYDFYYSFKKFTESYLTCPKEGYWSVGHSDVFVGREDGVNEKGLAIAMTGVSERSIKPGVNFILAVRCVLDKCASVEESIKTLSKTRFSTTNNYLVADKEGRMAVVEASPDRVRVRKPEKSNHFIVCTNHFLHPEMLKMENRKERCWDSVPRYTTIYNALKQKDGKIDANTAQKILSNHEGHVCSHQRKIKLGTIWSISATLRKLQILRAEGHPCRAKYNIDDRLNKALKMRQRHRNSSGQT